MRSWLRFIFHPLAVSEIRSSAIALSTSCDTAKADWGMRPRMGRWALRRRLDVADCRAKPALQLRNRHAQKKSWEVNHGPDRRDRTFCRRHVSCAGTASCCFNRQNGLHRLRRGHDRGLARAGGGRGGRACRQCPAGASVRARLPAHAGERPRDALRGRRARARFRRHRALRPSQRRAGARDPGAGTRKRCRRQGHDRGLCRGLRGVGGADRARPGPASPQGLAPQCRVRPGSRRRGRGSAAPARCRAGEPRGRHRGLARRRRGRQFRLDDQVVPPGSRRAIRADRGAARRSAA